MQTQIRIKRFSDNGIQTLGLGECLDKPFKFFTLELPDKKNQRKISCIPKGVYQVVVRSSDKYGKHFHILNVPNRGFVLVHAGNYYTQIEGCILVGASHADINKDGHKDVTASKATLEKLLTLYPSGFTLSIE